MGLNYSEAYGKEIFLACSAEYNEGELYLTEDIYDLDFHILSRPSPIVKTTIVLHGIITSAEYLPINIEGHDVYVICADVWFKSGFVVKTAVKTIEDFANELESIIEAKQWFSTNTGNDSITIDALHLFFGYQIPVQSPMDIDRIDDQQLYENVKLFESSEDVAIALLANKYKQK